MHSKMLLRKNISIKLLCGQHVYGSFMLQDQCWRAAKQGYKLNHPVKREFNMDKWHAWKLGLVFTRAGSGDESTQQLIRRALENIAQAEAERLN